jgi:hypothetical protein
MKRNLLSILFFDQCWSSQSIVDDMEDFICSNFYAMVPVVPLTPLHWRPLQNATISNINSDNCKALQKMAKSDSFVTDKAAYGDTIAHAIANIVPQSIYI